MSKEEAMSITERFERAIQELVRQGFHAFAVAVVGRDARSEMARMLVRLPAPAVVWSQEDHAQMARAVAPCAALALFWRGDGAALRALHDAFAAAGFAIAWTESMGAGMGPAMDIRVPHESGRDPAQPDSTADQSDTVAAAAVT